MKVRIIEERPGELAERADDVRQVVHRLTEDALRKAETPKAPLQVEYRSLTEMIRGMKRTHVNAVRSQMDAKIAKVLGG